MIRRRIRRREDSDGPEPLTVTPKVEREHEEAFPEIFRHTDRLVVGGSTALAISMGKSLEGVNDVDIFHVTNGYEEGILGKTFETIEELQEALPNDIATRVAAFIERNGLEGKKIDFITMSSVEREENMIYEDEPEVVLWSQAEEIVRDIVPEKTEGKCKELLERLRELPYDSVDYDVRRTIESQLSVIKRMHLYDEGVLVRGVAPYMVTPKKESLSRFLRLLDLGERFGIDIDFYNTYMYEDADIKNEYRLMVSTQEEEVQESSQRRIIEDGKTNSFARIVRRNGFGEEYEIDYASVDVFKKKGMGEEARRRLPNLHKRMGEIIEAGGLEAYIKENFGEGYIERGFVDSKDPNLGDIGLGADEQASLLSAWDNRMHSNGAGAYDRGSMLCESIYGFAVQFSHWRDENPDLELSALDPDGIYQEVSDFMVEAALSGKGSVESRKAVYLKLLHQAKIDLYSGVNEKYEAQRDNILMHLKNEPAKSIQGVVHRELGHMVAESDPELEGEFLSRVKAANARIKSSSPESSRDGIFNKQEMMALRAVIEMRNTNADAVVFSILANPNIDPRMKKVCLAPLRERVFSEWSFGESVGVVGEDLEKSASDIRWEDYGALHQVYRTPSKTLREKLWYRAVEVFKRIRSSDKYGTIKEAREELAPNMRAEAFFSLVSESGFDSNILGDWDSLFEGMKSRSLEESFLFPINTLNSYGGKFVQMVTEKVIHADKVTEEHIRLARRLLDKINFLRGSEDSALAGHVEVCQAESCSVCGTGEFKRDADDIEVPTIWERLKDSEAPSILEADIDADLVKSLYRLTGRKDLTAEKIQRLFAGWGEIEPLLVYASNLSGNTRAMSLLGEMLVHMDPPGLKEWKGWRYDIKDAYVANHLEGLDEVRINEWQKDHVVDLGEVLVGLLPEDKPDRIRETIIHALEHDWQEEGIRPHRAVQILENELKPKQGFDSHADYVESAESSIAELGIQRDAIRSVLVSLEDIRVLKNLPDTFVAWSRSEKRKREALTEFDIPEDSGREVVEAKIKELKAQKADGALISRLASLKPRDMPQKARGVFEKYKVKADSSIEDINNVIEQINGSVSKMMESEIITMLSDRYLDEEDGKKPNVKVLKSLIRDVQTAELMTKLTLLSPRLIAYNKISQEKKRTSLRETMHRLGEFFEGRPEMLSTLESVQEIIDEFSEPLGRDHLIVIETDNPLVSLTIGKYPNGATSCQNYENGAGVLTAYMADADKKMCILVDVEKLPRDVRSALSSADGNEEEQLRIFSERTSVFLEAMVARRIIKLVHSDESNEPQVFLEPVYTAMNRDRTTQTMDAYAKTHIEEAMKLPILKGADAGDMMVRVEESKYGGQYEDGRDGGPGVKGGGLGIMIDVYHMRARLLIEADYVAAAEQPLKAV